MAIIAVHIKRRPYPDLSALVKTIRVGLQYPVLRYLGKDETIEFKVREIKKKMTEPVAYKSFDNDSKREFLRFTPSSFNDNVPLYTKEQLHPRVKMTQAEFDEFKKLLSVGISTIYEAFDVIVSDRGEMDEFEQLYNRLFTNGVNEQVKQQNEFATLWANYNPDDPEETIEIVPDMKWFVETKNTTSDYRFLKIEFENKSVYNKSLKMYATHFETQSQAESWVNPLTKVVKLPLEEHL